jgi:drug/metabolite transporter (DMT)-like permease
MASRGFRPVDYALLVTLAAIWGSSFLFIKLAVETIPPATLVAARLWLAAGGLLLFLHATGQRLPRGKANWTAITVIAVVGNVVPFAMISWGELAIDSGLAAILMSAMPLTSFVLAHIFISDERLSPTRLLGVIVGFAGIVVLVGPDALAGLGREVVAQLVVAGAACLYAVSNVYTRTSRVTALPAAGTTAGVLLCAAVLSLPFALAIDRPWTLAPSSGSIWALIVLSLLCTSAANLILFHLLATTGATFVALINYMVPLFGVFWGAVFLGEALRLEALSALVLILCGVALTQIRRRSGPKAQRQGK